MDDFPKPYSIPARVVAGETLLQVPPGYRNPNLAVSWSRIFISPGVSTVMFSWSSPERAVSNLRYMRVDSDFGLVSSGTWTNLPALPAAVDGVPSTLTVQISSEYGAVVLANISGVPSDTELANEESMGVTVVPSPPPELGA